MAININKYFGKEVKRYRKEKKLSQLELAEAARVDLSRINRVARGIENITLRNVFKITKALHVPLYKFIFVDNPTKKLDRDGKIKF